MSVIFSWGLKRPRPGTSQDGRSSYDESGLALEGVNNRAFILIHGLTGSPNEMRFLANSLNSRGYAVFCPRLANHGKPLAELKYTKWQDFYLSARKVFLEAAAKYDMIFTAGLSMGALLALLLAEEFPGRIAGVCCLSPTLFYDGWNTPKSKFFLPLVTSTPLRHFFYFKEESPYGLKNAALRRLVHKHYSQARLDDVGDPDQYGYPFFPVTLLGELARLVEYLKPRLKDVRSALLLIQASQDDMTSVKNSRFIYERVSSGQKELILLENSYHIVSADLERERVAAEMGRFADRIAGRTVSPEQKERGI